jgi:tetratricopeptide (TPR) repeat protein
MAKKFVEYSGDIVTDEKDPFAKGESGFALGTAEQQKEDIGGDWWHLPLATALGGALGAAGTYLYNQNKDKSATPPIDRTRDIPMGNQPVAPPTGQSRTLAEAQQMAAKALEGRVVNDAAKSVVQEVATQVAQSVAPPTVTESVQAGQSPTKAIQSDLAPMVDQAAQPAPPPEDKSVKTRVRRTAEQIAADKLAAEAASPPGFHPTYKKRTGEMGPGAFNWLYNLKGPEEAIKFWEEAVGKKNVPYSEFVKNYNLASGENITGPVKSVKPSVNAGTPTHVPNYIKGGATPGSLGGLAAMAALLGLGNTEKAQAAMAKAVGAIKDIGISPDIFAGKGEELGRLGQGYVTAGNPNYVRELSSQLATERDPERRLILQNEIRKAGGVSPAMR